MYEHQPGLNKRDVVSTDDMNGLYLACLHRATVRRHYLR